MRILLIEDDLDLCNALSYQLRQEQCKVECCFDGSEAELYLKQNIYDLVLLDCMLPGTDGLSILQQMRRQKNFTPVIILSALGEVDQRVTGLTAGADDYLVKPFAFSELMARIQSIFRRKADFQEKLPSFGDLVLQTAPNLLCCQDCSCSLSQTEYELMRLLLEGGGETIPRPILLHKVWGTDTSVEDSNLDNYIYFLRRRLKTLDSTVKIRNQRGIGFFLSKG